MIFCLGVVAKEVITMMEALHLEGDHTDGTQISLTLLLVLIVYNENSMGMDVGRVRTIIYALKF